MRQILKFIGTGGAFSSKYVNNSAYYYLKNDEILLFDCGETVFHEILKLDIITEKIKRIDIVITHFHSDHVGSLGSLIFYLRFKKIKEVNVIFPIKTLPYMLLQIYGIDESLFKVKLPEEVDGYYIKEYEQLHGDVDVDGNIVSMPSYGYHVVNDNDNFFYSGDTCIISDIILEKFKSKEIKIMYHEVTTDGYKSHMQLENLVKIIPVEDRQRVVCMHMGDGVDVSKIKKFGLESVR